MVGLSRQERMGEVLSMERDIPGNRAHKTPPNLEGHQERKESPGNVGWQNQWLDKREVWTRAGIACFMVGLEKRRAGKVPTKCHHQHREAELWSA